MLNSNVLKKAPWWSLFVCLYFLANPCQAMQHRAAIASAHPLATQAGMSILQKGGNAFDAAVTVSAVLAVVEPYSSGIGGGGFWLLHRASDQYQVMVDGREKAPLAAHRDMYLDEQGQVIKNASINGALSAGIPGEPAALAHIAQHYGKLSLAESLMPAIVLAENGFAVDAYYQKMARWRLSALQQSLTASEIFLQQDQVPEVGYRVIQKDLAETLRRLARLGHDGFYRGDTAKQLVNAVQQAGGIWSLKDLSDYQVVERPPVRFSYLDQEITTAALPSSGGIVMGQILNILSLYDLQAKQGTDRFHLIIEAMRRAYKDRALYLGDADYVDVPDHLLSLSYARELATDIDLAKASKSQGLPVTQEGMDTTHFSILDSEGNRVSATLSINYPFGSGFVAAGTGVLLNDEMDDFSSSPGVPNVYGLVGSDANAIEPGKRMLSSMTPTFVESKKGLAIVGTPGGSRIITMVLLAILEQQNSTDPQDWVDLPRYHHQYLPDVVQHEKTAFSEQVIQQLKALGHALKPLDNTYGNMQAIYLDKTTGQVKAASDRRGIGKAIVH